jgi:nonribosomal peptide synthetase protein BlmVI
VEALRRHARQRPGNDAYVFLADGETEAGRLTFAEVDLRARAVAAELQARGAAGQRVLICYPACLDYVVALLGCFYAGAVAVPCDSSSRGAGPERLRLIVTDAQPALMLGPAAPPGTGDDRTVPSGFAALDVAEVPDSMADSWREPQLAAGTLALLQYTSGSTREPRGVMVSHGNVLANELSIAHTCQHDSSSTFVGWLPLFHDMGLIANTLQPAYLGSLAVLMPPTAFLEQPARWLHALTRYRGHTSGGPNFAYDLCVARITPEQRQGLDLSSWKAAFNGAEVVRPATLRRFTEAFGSVGFRAETHFPCYGLAEATLIAAGAPRGRPPATVVADPAVLRQGRLAPAAQGQPGTALAACGPAAYGSTIKIVDPQTSQELPAGSLGEIWIAGPSVAQGYWGRPAETSATFGARLAGTQAGPFLRTGDLGGFAAGELVITGRLKDLIVIRGQNHYPHDIEWTAEASHPALRPSCGAAFPVDADGAERLVIVYETKAGQQADPGEIAAAVRTAVAQRHGLDVHAVILAQRGGVPKTTSGKVRRQSCREALLSGQLPVLAESWRRPPAGGRDAAQAALPTRASVSSFWPRPCCRRRKAAAAWQRAPQGSPSRPAPSAWTRLRPPSPRQPSRAGTDARCRRWCSSPTARSRTSQRRCGPHPRA